MGTENAFEHETLLFIEVLKSAHDKISKINSHHDVAPLKTRILSNLKKEVNNLSILIGVTPDATYAMHESKVSPTPLTKMFGKDLQSGSVVTKDNIKSIVESSDVISKKDLQIQADELYNRFLLLTPDDIMGSISSDIIELIAVKAGFKEEEVPDTINAEFVTSLIERIKENATPKYTTREEQEIEELTISRDQLYDNFNTIEPDKILDSYPEIVIRAVAKKAGLPVTESNPKKIDIKYLEQIKAAITQVANIDKLGNTSK